MEIKGNVLPLDKRIHMAWECNRAKNWEIFYSSTKNKHNKEYEKKNFQR